MRLLLLRSLAGCCVYMLIATGIQAAIIVTTTPNIQTFDTAPNVVDWSTGSSGTSSTGVGNISQQDTLVQTLSISSIATALPTTATVGTFGLARYNSTAQNLLTSPTGTTLTLLLATLQNGTGTTQSDVAIQYDLSFGQGTLSTEQLGAHRVYYSSTGLANSWTVVGTLGGNGNTLSVVQPQNFSVSLGSWAAGDPLYVLFADDNADGGTEAALQIDNFSAVAVPEPSFLAVGALALIGVCGLVRRQRG